jgi:hypothetical protein
MAGWSWDLEVRRPSEAYQRKLETVTANGEAEENAVTFLRNGGSKAREFDAARKAADEAVADTRFTWLLNLAVMLADVTNDEIKQLLEVEAERLRRLIGMENEGDRTRKQARAAALNRERVRRHYHRHKSAERVLIEE